MMYHFFVEESQISGEEIRILGADVNHIKNVLRMRQGDQLIISKIGDDKKDYYCSIKELSYEVLLHIDWVEEGRELSSKLYLFQGLPKADKMELIIQKAVELGAFEIVPVACKRSVVKLDGKKADNKIIRWQAIAESAAKQSKRSIIPSVHEALGFKEALEYARQLDVRLMPYENAKGVGETRRIFSEIEPGKSVGILVGPEGGFDPQEAELAKEEGFMQISLGKRILRTETAGFTVLSALMLHLEE